MFLLRDHRPSDFESLYALDQLCFTDGIAYTREALKHFLSQRGAAGIIALAGKELAGFVIAHRTRSASGHIITIDVHSKFRRAKLGSTLLRAAEDRMAEKGAEAMMLEVAVDNTAAITFYKRHGYSVLRTLPRYYLDSLDGLLMGKISAGDDTGQAASPALEKPRLRYHEQRAHVRHHQSAGLAAVTSIPDG